MPPNRTSTIYLRTDGKTEVKRDFAESGEAGKAALGGVSKAADGATAALQRAGKAARGAANDVSAMERASQLASEVAAASSNARAYRAPAVRDYGVNPRSGEAFGSRADVAAFKAEEAAAESLRGRIDELYVATQRYAREQATADRLLASGAITAKEHAAYLALERTALDQATEAAKRHGNAFAVSDKQKRAGRLNLIRQGADVFTTGAMGMDPGMIAIQQGPQVLDALAMSGVRMTAAMGVAAAALLAVGGAALVVEGDIARTSRDMREFTSLLEANADGARYNARELTDLARYLDLAGASADEARGEVRAFVAEGIVPERLHEFGDAARDLSKVMGMDVTAAANTVAKAFTGTYKEVDALDKQINFLTDSENKHIKTLFESGKAAEGRNEAFALFTDRYAKAYNESLSEADRLTRSLGGAWDGFVQSLSHLGPIEDANRGLANIADNLTLMVARLQDVQTLNAQQLRFEAVRAGEAYGKDIDRVKAAQKNVDDWHGPKNALYRFYVEELVKAKAQKDEDYARFQAVVTQQNANWHPPASDTTLSPDKDKPATDRSRGASREASETSALLWRLMTEDEQITQQYKKDVELLTAAIKARPAEREHLESALQELKREYDLKINHVYDLVKSEDIKLEKFPELGKKPDLRLDDIKDGLKEVAELTSPVRESLRGIADDAAYAFEMAGGNMKDFGDLFIRELQRDVAAYAASGFRSMLNSLIDWATGRNVPASGGALGGWIGGIANIFTPSNTPGAVTQAGSYGMNLGIAAPTGFLPSTPLKGGIGSDIRKVAAQSSVTIVHNHKYDLTGSLTTREFMESVDQKVKQSERASSAAAVQTALSVTRQHVNGMAQERYLMEG